MSREWGELLCQPSYVLWIIYIGPVQTIRILWCINRCDKAPAPPAILEAHYIEMDSNHAMDLERLGVTYEALLDFVRKQRIGTEVSN